MDISVEWRLHGPRLHQFSQFSYSDSSFHSPPLAFQCVSAPPSDVASVLRDAAPPPPQRGLWIIFCLNWVMTSEHASG